MAKFACLVVCLAGFGCWVWLLGFGCLGLFAGLGSRQVVRVLGLGLGCWEGVRLLFSLGFRVARETEGKRLFVFAVHTKGTVTFCLLRETPS